MRRGKRRRRSAKNYFISFAIIIVILGSIFVWAISLPVWQIKKIKISGNVLTPTEIILAASKNLEGENIFLFRKRALEQKLEKYQEIKKLIIKKYPPSAIEIVVIERKPFAVVAFKNKSVLIDNEGVVLSDTKSAKGVDISNLPVISGLPENTIDGKTISAVEQSLATISKFIDPKKVQMDISSSGELNLVVEDILKIKVGDPSDVDEKLGVLKLILKDIWPKRTSVEYIDLRVKDSPVVKFRK